MPITILRNWPEQEQHPPIGSMRVIDEGTFDHSDLLNPDLFKYCGTFEAWLRCQLLHDAVFDLPPVEFSHSFLATLTTSFSPFLMAWITFYFAVEKELWVWHSAWVIVHRHSTNLTVGENEPRIQSFLIKPSISCELPIIFISIWQQVLVWTGLSANWLTQFLIGICQEKTRSMIY